MLDLHQEDGVESKLTSVHGTGVPETMDNVLRRPIEIAMIRLAEIEKRILTFSFSFSDFRMKNVD